MSTIEHSPTKELLDKYYEQLAKHFPEKYVKYYAVFLQDSMNLGGSGRDFYRENCQYLQKIMQLGTKAEAAKIANK